MKNQTEREALRLILDIVYDLRANPNAMVSGHLMDQVARVTQGLRENEAAQSTLTPVPSQEPERAPVEIDLRGRSGTDMAALWSTLGVDGRRQAVVREWLDMIFSSERVADDLLAYMFRSQQRHRFSDAEIREGLRALEMIRREVEVGLDDLFAMLAEAEDEEEENDES